MISTVLVEHPWMTTTALVALVVFGPVAGAWLLPRPRVTRVLLGVCLVPVALLALVPTSRELAAGCAVEWSVPTLGAVELMANVVLFVPLVLLAGVLTRRPAVALVAASGLAALIELVQAVVPALGRSCSTDDWLSNTLGAALGAVLAVAGLWLASRCGSATAQDEGKASTRRPAP
ncbi:VanZ family protein [Jiangella ureilytica]|uniref:VanZ family protein n=1 Tax=Jiangella ureilytica TaxID=2530374 RepID=A0A4R4RAS8_9ACTN|nr:VanZ family protein [Jiangella ureilytica]TDC46176.1 VanZ family protein [Jiangella ureilytica]